MNGQIRYSASYKCVLSISYGQEIDLHNKGLVTIKWERQCIPIEERGLGVRNLFEFNMDGIIKLCMGFSPREEAVVRLCKGKIL